ncbi:MAG: cytochrome c oxidase assembly protein, partial [Lysobacterales bacterium]
MQRVGEAATQRTRIHLVLAAVAVLMFGFAFALIPPYDSLCRVLGINGQIQQAESPAADVS